MVVAGHIQLAVGKSASMPIEFKGSAHSADFEVEAHESEASDLVKRMATGNMALKPSINQWNPSISAPFELIPMDAYDSKKGWQCLGPPTSSGHTIP